MRTASRIDAMANAGFCMAISALAGCGAIDQMQGVSNHEAGPTSGPAHTVMVIDDGFDPSDSVFKDKIVAQYTLQCAADKATDGDAHRTFAEDKALYLKALAVADTTCTLVEGIKPKISASLTSYEDYRDGWNRFVKSKGADRSGVTRDLQDNVKDIENAVSGADISYHYHGTGTAGLISYQNPSVKLVLVERQLGEATSSTAEVDGCPDAASFQANFQRSIDLARDPDIQTAMINRPLSTEESGLADLAAKYGVGLINESFGSLSRQALDKALADSGCPTVDLKSFYKLQGDITARRDAFVAKQKPAWDQALRVQAAGNDGARIDSTEDSFECAHRGTHTVLIGALTGARAITKFSDYGKCVDGYTLGENVIIAAPDDFLNIESGTSFSAPLVVRFLSLNTPEKASSDDMLTFLKSKTDPVSYLPAEAVPASLSYDDKNTVLDLYSLTGAAPHRRNFTITPRPARNYLDNRRLPFAVY